MGVGRSIHETKRVLMGKRESLSKFWVTGDQLGLIDKE